MFSLQAKLIALVILATFLAGTHFKAYRSGQAAVKLEWQADIQARTAAALEAESAARAKEQALQAKADEIRRAKNAQIQSLGLELSESLARLRNRPERPASGNVPAVAGTGGSCTGASLWREDGEFLRREATRADELRAGLEACQQAYRAARAMKPVAK